MSGLQQKLSFVLVLICFTSVISLNTSLIANTVISEIEITQSEYTVKKVLNTENGLPANGVSMILQDSRGYIWAATFNGLVRYEGKRITVFNTSNVPGLETNRFVSVMEDQHGRIWAGLEYSSFIMIDGNQTMVYRIDEEIAETNTYITSLYVNSGGDIWIGTNSGIYTYSDNSYSKLYNLPGEVVQNITEIYGHMHIVFESSLYVKYDQSLEFEKILEISENVIHFKSGLTITEFSQIDRLWNIYPHNNSYLLVHENGIVTINDDGYEIHLHKNDINQSILHGLVEKDGYVYVYGADGLYEFEDFFGENRVAQKLTDIRVTDMMFDNEGSAWLSTSARGIIQFVKTPVNQGGRFSSVAEVPVTAIIEDSYENLWMGTNCDGLYKFSGLGVQRYGIDEGITNVCVWSVLEASDGTIWAGSWGGGVYYLEPERDVFVRFIPEIMESTDAILSVFEDKNGNLWFGSFDKGLFRYDGETTHSIKNETGGNLSAVRMMYEDDSGTILFATDRGIGYYDGQRIVKPKEFNQLKNKNFRVIKKDTEGRFWFGSYGAGIYVYTPGGSNRSITTENGLFDNTISQIQFDSENNVWLAGNMGVFFINAEQVSQFMNNETDYLKVSRIGVAEGLPTRETTGGFMPSSHFNPATGELFIPLVRGVAMIQTENMQLNTQIPALFLEEIEMNGNVYFPEEIVEIPYDAQRIIFRFTVLSFINPDYVQVQYKLDGVDTQWQLATDSREIIYTTLPVGDYRLILRASNNDGYWTDEITLHTFTIKPPYWQTAWFILLVIGFIGTIVFGMYWYRLKNIRKMNVLLQKKVDERTSELRMSNRELKEMIEEKNKLQRVLAHDLRNPFTAILGYIDLLKNNYKREKNKENLEIMEMLLDSGRNTLNLLENLLHWSSSKSGGLKIELKPVNIQILVDEAIESTEAQATFKNIKVKSHFHDPLFVEADQNMILTVLRNLISNAIKFSGRNESVNIYYEENESEIIISVSDNGIGIKKEIFSSEKLITKTGTSGEKGIGIGLQICKEFIDLHEGRLWADSKPDQGSIFKFSLRKSAVFEEAFK